MYISLKLPLSPSRAQEQLFVRYAGTARWAYNWAVAEWLREYELGNDRPSTYDMQRRMTVLKRLEETKWIADVSKHVPERAIANANFAFINFFRGCKAGRKVGFPKFKKRGKSRQSFSFNLTRLASIRGRNVIVPKIGAVSIARRHFTIPDNARAISLTITKTSERWHASVEYEIPDSPFAPNHGPVVGVDLGLTTLATLSTGEKIESPKPLRAAQRRLKRKQRRLSSSQPGSARREKKRRIVARAYARVRNIRQNSIHQLTSRLAKNHGKVVIENLSITSMMSNRRLAFAIGDTGWGAFSKQLSYKCPRYGAVLVIADMWYPSSKTCSNCGQIQKSLPLTIRKWTCGGCDAVHDRDINAALNLEQLGRNTPEVTPVEIGNQVSRKTNQCRSEKREAVAAAERMCSVATEQHVPIKRINL